MHNNQNDSVHTPKSSSPSRILGLTPYHQLQKRHLAKKDVPQIFQVTQTNKWQWIIERNRSPRSPSVSKSNT